MTHPRAAAAGRLVGLVACVGMAILISLWFVVLGTYSFQPRLDVDVPPRADLGFAGQMGLGLGVFCAAAIFVWAGVASLRRESRRRTLVAAVALLVVAAAAAVLALRAPTLIHPVREVSEGVVDKSLEGAGPWVTYFWTVGGGALGCAALLVALAPRRDEDWSQAPDLADSR